MELFIILTGIYISIYEKLKNRSNFKNFKKIKKSLKKKLSSSKIEKIPYSFIKI